MNWDRAEGDWKQIKGSVKEQWGGLTDDQLDVIAGKRDQLAGKIGEAYGITKDEVEKRLAAWQANWRRSEIRKPPAIRRVTVHDINAGHGENKMNTMRGYVVGSVAVAMLLGLGGCAGMSRQDRDTAIGAGVGGAAGLVLGGGVLGTAAGAVVGGVVGHEVGKK